MRVNSARRTMMAIYKTYIDVIHYRLEERGELAGQSEEISTMHDGSLASSDSTAQSLMGNGESGEGRDGVDGVVGAGDDRLDADDNEELNEEARREKEALWAIARSPDVYQRLVRSFAQSVWELQDVKMGILCQLFGGSSKSFKEKGTFSIMMMMMMMMMIFFYFSFFFCIPKHCSD